MEKQRGIGRGIETFVCQVLLSSGFKQPCEVDIGILILQMRTQKPGEVKEDAQGHRALIPVQACCHSLSCFFYHLPAFPRRKQWKLS